ncbi:ATP-binding protein [Phenylobacterium sp.]|uniref:ATP-binding protein n=1 Tax=Phenylobacterium sp. TaxID=1871053 RepID=UPI003569147F
MSPRPGTSTDANYGLPHAVAFTIQASRNLVVQAVGVGMVVITGLIVLPWPLVAGWAAATTAVVTLEHQLLRVVTKGGRFAGRAAAFAPVLRVMATTLYALAALFLVSKGGGGERLFAFALICASMVHVLMRYYRTRWILLVSLAPHVAVLALIAFVQARTALAAGHRLQALAATFTLGTFALQFWSARAQLIGAWTELASAREAAEDRERAAEAANRAKSDFLATMSHELRTPLNGVLGMAQVLTTEQLTPAQHERVRIIRRSSESLLAVLNDLLDLSKIEACALELEVAEFDLEHLVRGVVAAYQPLADKKGLSFAFDVDEAARGRYLGDSPRIRRMLYSLADNAVKFTDTGGVTLSVAREAGALVFRVADTGIGIAYEHQAQLFDGFFQADGGRTRRYGGAGLGLAICRQMTQMMDGAIEAVSAPGQGSTFILRLPLKPIAAGVAADDAQRSGAAEPSAEIRVLVAEDNATNQLVLKALLAQAGIVPTMVENGRQALEAWEAQDWDMILMDIQMPVMDGVAATRAIRERELATGRGHTPIIAVTANAMTHQVAEYEAAGMDDMVPKPIDVPTLFAAMKRALDKDATAEPAKARPGASAA